MQEKGTRGKARRVPGFLFDMDGRSAVWLRLLATGEDLHAEYVGQADNQYILLRIPRLQGMREKLLRDNGLELRYHQQGEVCVFSSQAVKYFPSPVPLLLAEFPVNIACQGLRGETRVASNLPCKLRGEFGEYRGLLTDLSRSGAAVVCRLETDAKLRRAAPGDAATLLLDLGGRGSVSAGVRIRRKDDLGTDKIRLGVEFEELGEVESEAVGGFLDELLDFADVV
ncbi:PilZ domain-containing protein [Desulfohalovibrio reitneri]|uniref:PilZ domain-containing protein n=1 Tax=Desulfohalovibrio reitneri TaxID=1307759 RepID=UPI0004A73C86|nr:PilZ domain-containing protein [Desulfohalovibrio reitneri]